MPTPLHLIDGPMPEDRMPEDRPEPSDYRDDDFDLQAWYWDDSDTIGGVPIWVYEDAVTRGER